MSDVPAQKLSVQQVREALLARATRRREPFGATMCWYVAERFAQRLEQSNWREHLLVDGDLFLHAMRPAYEPYDWRAELVWRRLGAEEHKLGEALAAVAATDSKDCLHLEIQLHPERKFGLVDSVTVVANLGGVSHSVRVDIRYHSEIGIDTNFQLPATLEGDSSTRPKGIHPAEFAAQVIAKLALGGPVPGDPRLYVHLQQIALSGTVEDKYLHIAVRRLVRLGAIDLSGDEPKVPLALRAMGPGSEAKLRLWKAFQDRARLGAGAKLEAVIADGMPLVRRILNAMAPTKGGRSSG